jgi:squalene synthase HpnC
MVRKGGLEPPWAAPLEPKSSASTNSATFAAAFAERASIADNGRHPPEDRPAAAPSADRKRILSACLVPLPVPVAHYENFPVASFLLPRRLRGPIVAIYGFARTADDVADEGDAPAPARLAALDRIGEALDRAVRGETAPDDPFPGLAEAIARHALPAAPFHDLLSAFRQDVTTTRYPGYADVLDYCRRSANPVGRLVLHLYGAASPANVALSDAICTGLQLVNFWQDVGEDWRRHRVYLPQEDLVRFGVTEAHVAEARCDERWRALLAFETARARSLLASGSPLPGALPWRLALELRAVLAGGHRVLDAIDGVGGDVFRHRPQLATADWAVVAMHALFPPRRQRAAALAT